MFPRPFRVASLLLCLPVCLCWLLAPAPPVRAQGPAIPESPEIAGYLYLLDPHALDRQLPALWRPLGIEGMMPNLADLLAVWTGDEKLQMATPLQPVVVVLLRDQSGEFRDVVVFPEAGSLNYLVSCARKRGKEGITEQGTSLIGTREAVAQAQRILPALKKLREATHPADFSLYLRSSLWKDRMEKILAFSCAPELSRIKLLLNLPEQKDAYLPAAVPRPTPAAKPKPAIPFGLQVLGRVFQDVETIHLALETNLKPNRLTLHISAAPGTPLARLLAQPAPNPLTEVLYLPEGGSLRGGVSLDMDALDAAIHDAVFAAGKDNPAFSQEQLGQIHEHYTRPLFLKGNGALYLNEAGMALFARSLDLSCADWLRQAVLNSDFAKPQADDLLARIDRVFPSAKPKAGARNTEVRGQAELVAVLMPRAGRKDLQRIKAMLSEPPQGRPNPEIILVLRNARAEEFTIDQFFQRTPNVPPPTQPLPPEQAILSASRVGDYLVLASRYREMKSVMGRILREDPLGSPLEAQKTFTDGAHAYADLTLPAQTPDKAAGKPAAMAPGGPGGQAPGGPGGQGAGGPGGQGAGGAGGQGAGGAGGQAPGGAGGQGAGGPGGQAPGGPGGQAPGDPGRQGAGGAGGQGAGGAAKPQARVFQLTARVTGGSMQFTAAFP